jgi:geranylgeranyl pyrophosphate synthase
MSDTAFSSFASSARAATDAELERLLADRSPGEPDPGLLREAMRYAVLGGGKRLRPLVCMACCRAAGAPAEAALPAAAAIELLHAYTLVHDDLPAMDNDTMRRGKPTVHVAFGHANAILAGDALLTAAFGALAGLGAHAADAVTVLAERTGVRWLLGGQARDIAGYKPTTIAELEVIHEGKTGALFSAAAELGAIAAGANRDARARLARWGMALGIAFQHADDRADGYHPALAAAATARIAELRAEMTDLVAPLGDAALLDELANRSLGL